MWAKIYSGIRLIWANPFVKTICFFVVEWLYFLLKKDPVLKDKAKPEEPKKIDPAGQAYSVGTTAKDETVPDEVTEEPYKRPVPILKEHNIKKRPTKVVIAEDPSKQIKHSIKRSRGKRVLMIDND